MSRKGWLIFGTAAFVIVILAISLFFIIMDAINSATVSVTVAPSVARVKIGNKEYDAIGTYRMAPGEYTVEISADGFETKVQTLVAEANETVSVLTYLEPTVGNSDWYSNHPEDALVVGETKNAQMLAMVQKLLEENPVLDKLPYEVEYYTENYSNKFEYDITYELVGDGDFKIIVKDYMGNGRELAEEWLKENGLNEYEYLDLSDDGLNARAF